MTHRSPPAVRRLSIIAAAATYLLVVWGGVVRVTGSGLGCGTRDDWPLCRGGVLPPWQQDAVIEFTHRWLAAMSTALVIAVCATAVVRWRAACRTRGGRAAARYRRRSAQISGVAVVLFIVQILLGGLTVKLRLPGWVIAVHLANAEFLLGTLILLAVRDHGEGTARATAHPRSPALTVVALAAGATYLLVISGALVVADGAGAACDGWPLCGNGFQVRSGGLAAVNISHRILVVLVVALIGAAVMRVRRAHRSDAGLRIAGLVATALLLAQIVAGAVVVKANLPPAARGIHLALASALWADVLLIALLTGSSPPAAGEAADAGRVEILGTGQRREVAPS